MSYYRRTGLDKQSEICFFRGAHSQLILFELVLADTYQNDHITGCDFRSDDRLEVPSLTYRCNKTDSSVFPGLLFIPMHAELTI